MASVEDNILHSLTKNGFPEKPVSLPFQAIFKACKKEGENLSVILHNLEQRDIEHRMTSDRILFFSRETAETANTPPSTDDYKGFDFSNQLVKDAMEKISEMDPADLEKLKKQVSGLSAEEKNELLKQAKGLFKKPAPE